MTLTYLKILRPRQVRISRSSATIHSLSLCRWREVILRDRSLPILHIHEGWLRRSWSRNREHSDWKGHGHEVDHKVRNGLFDAIAAWLDVVVLRSDGEFFVAKILDMKLKGVAEGRFWRR